MDMELTKTREELVRLRERYDRLMDSHKKMQRLNNNLEDKLLRLVSTQSFWVFGWGRGCMFLGVVCFWLLFWGGSFSNACVPTVVSVSAVEYKCV